MRSTLLLVVLGAAFAMCGGGGTVTSPVVRVDLRDRLPLRAQRRAYVHDTSYPCSKALTLSAQGAEQRFIANWRVLDDRGTRHITAVEIVPEGETSGAREPSASAVVEDTTSDKKGDDLIAVVPVRLVWTATKGCSRVTANARLELRADDKSCRAKPQSRRRLLTP